MKRYVITKPQVCRLFTKSGEISYNLKKSSRRRSLEISISNSLEVDVRAPIFMPQKEIGDFIRHKSEWILARLKEARDNQAYIAKKSYAHGHEFLFLGIKYPLHIIREDIYRPKIDFTGYLWRISLPVSTFQRQEKLIKLILVRWYKKQAKELFGSRIFYFARLMGLEPLRVCVKTQKSLWGSCGLQKKSINLNWKLILTPLTVIDYVIVHELSHLVYPNHSRRFWKKVATYLPDYKQRQKWLKDNHLEMVMP